MSRSGGDGGDGGGGGIFKAVGGTYASGEMKKKGIDYGDLKDKANEVDACRMEASKQRRIAKKKVDDHAKENKRALGKSEDELSQEDKEVVKKHDTLVAEQEAVNAKDFGCDDPCRAAASNKRREAEERVAKYEEENKKLLQDPKSEDERSEEDKKIIKKYKTLVAELEAVNAKDFGCDEDEKESPETEKDFRPSLDDPPAELSECRRPEEKEKEEDEKRPYVFPEDRAIPQQRPPTDACGLGRIVVREGRVCGDTETANAATPKDAATKDDTDVQDGTATRFPVAVLGYEAGKEFVEKPAWVEGLRQERERVRREREKVGTGFGWTTAPRLSKVRRWLSNPNRPRGWILILVAVAVAALLLFALEKLPLKALSAMKSRFVVTALARQMESSPRFLSFFRQLDSLDLFLSKLMIVDFVFTSSVYLMVSQPLLYPKYVLGLAMVAIIPLTFSGNFMLFAKSVNLQARISTAVGKLRMWMTRREWTRKLLFLVPSRSVAETYIPRLLVVMSTITPLFVFRKVLSTLRPTWDEWLFDAVPPVVSSFIGLLSGLSTLLLFVVEDVLSSTTTPSSHPPAGESVGGRRRMALDSAPLYVACSVLFFIAIFVIMSHMFPHLRRYNHLNRLEKVSRHVKAH